MFCESLLSSVYSTIPPDIFIPYSPTTYTRPSTILPNTSRIVHRQMKIGKYYLERTIGKGNFAVVKLATHCDTHQKVAIKIIDKSRLNPPDHKKLEREIAVMKSLKHPYIIRLYEVMESKNLIYLVTEYAANGELLDLLLREKRLTEAKAKEIFRQLVLAVEYVHSKNIVHRDLKAENLLLDSQGNIKVADFGFANVFRHDTKLQTFCGSPPYAAPELFQCLPYSPAKVDVWSLGVLLYVFVCGHLPFDSTDLAELRKNVLAGQFRLPFYISSDCSSLIRHMLTINPEQRYTINDIQNHSWMMLNNSPISKITPAVQSIPNCQLTNAILDHAEALGYNRTQILKSVHGNSYDSDAAIWHLLLDKFQQTCQIKNEQPSDTRADSADNEDDYSPSCDSPRSSDDDEEEAEFLREEYKRTHGLRRHTGARPDVLGQKEVILSIVSKLKFTHPSTSIEPSHLMNRLNHLHRQEQYRTLNPPTIEKEHFHSEPQASMYHQRNPHSTSSNGLFRHLPVAAVSENYNHQQRNNHWLSPPISNHFRLNRRASDSGTHLLLFHQQHDVTSSNTISASRPIHPQSPLSNGSSRGSITRGAPIASTFSITPHAADENDEEEDAETLARYLNRGKRHTVCEQEVALGGKARRGGIRETVKDRGPLSRRASDTSSSLINSSAKAHLERLYRNAVGSKLSDDDDVTTSSLQELHQLQKKVQKYPIKSNSDSPINRRSSVVSSPTNSLGLHIIREEHQQNSFLPSKTCSNKSSSSSSSDEALHRIDDDHEEEMDCDVSPPLQSQKKSINRPTYPSYRVPYHHHTPPPYYCNTSPLLAQHLSKHTATFSHTP